LEGINISVLATPVVSAMCRWMGFGLLATGLLLKRINQQKAEMAQANAQAQTEEGQEKEQKQEQAVAQLQSAILVMTEAHADFMQLGALYE
jgi:hypothetical protein